MCGVFPFNFTVKDDARRKRVRGVEAFNLNPVHLSKLMEIRPLFLIIDLRTHCTKILAPIGK